MTMQRTIRRTIALGIAGAAIGLTTLAAAGEFRRLRPIPYPATRAEGTLRTVGLPPGAIPVDKARPVDPKLVKKALSEIMGSWNTPELRKKLDPSFINKDRLTDVVRSRVPRDASLRLLSVQSVRTMAQYLEPGSSVLVSRVAARATTQIELRDPRQGFRRGEGTNEYILTVRQKVAAGM